MKDKTPAADSETARRFTNNAIAAAVGQVMVLICVSLIALLAMIAIVADFSFMQHTRGT